MAVQCPVCEGSRCHRAGEYRRRGDGLAADALMACEDCGLTFAFPLPSPSALEEYNRHYWLQAHGGLRQTKLAWATDAGLNAARAHYIVDQLGARLSNGLQVLEIGPGRGHLLSQLRRLRSVDSYDAVESDESCHAKLVSQGGSVFARVEDLAPLGRGYHLILVSHVLEHMSDPVGFMAPLVGLLDAGGFVFVETPCRDHLFKPIHEPHLMFFDKKPMGTLLGRVGCDLVVMSYHGPRIAALAVSPQGMNRFARRLQDAVWSRVAEVRLAGKTMDTMDLDQLRPYIRHFDAETPRSEPCWWLRTLAVKRAAPITARS